MLSMPAVISLQRVLRDLSFSFNPDMMESAKDQMEADGSGVFSRMDWYNKTWWLDWSWKIRCVRKEHRAEAG